VSGCREDHHQIIHLFFVRDAKEIAMARHGCFLAPIVYLGWPVEYKDILGFVMLPPIFQGQDVEAPPGVELDIYILFDPTAE